MNNQTAYTLLWRSLLVMSILLLTTMPSQAANVIGLSLMDASDGDVVRIEVDQLTSFERFELDGPPRLLLKLKDTAVGRSVHDVQATGDGVRSVKAGMDGTTALIELTLSERLPFRVEQKLNALLIRFSAASPTTMDGAEVTGVRVLDRDDVTELVFSGQNMNANYNVFLTENKQQLILDMWGARSALPKEFYEYAAQRVRNVVIGQSDDRLRVIVGLIPTVSMQQQVEAKPNQLVVRLGKVSVVNSAKEQVVESIDFEPENQNARIIVRTSSTEPVIRVHEENDNVIVDIQHMTLAKGLERSLDVRQFPGPIAQMDSYQLDDSVRIVARLRNKTAYSSFQQGNVFTLRLKPEASAQGLTRGDTGGTQMVYAGQKSTFEFKDMDIRSALSLIAEMSHLNIIMSSDVQGTITMRLIDVPWDQALDLILTTKGLGKQQAGNVLRIAPLTVLQEEYANRLAARQGSEQLEPLITEFITLDFAKVADVQTMLKSTGGAAAPKDKATTADTKDSLLTSRGSVLIDERTNTLILKDTQVAINNVKRLIAKIDQPVRQVLIESRIVEATDNFQRDIGVRWGGYMNQKTGFNFPGTVALGAAGTTQANAAAFGAGNGAGVTAGNLVDLAAGTGPGAGGAIGLTLGSFNGAVNLNLELSAAEADDKIKIVSSPRVITSNMKKATIKQGVQVGVVSPGAPNTPATTKLVDASLTLDVTPQITSNDGIIMDVTVTKDTPTIFNGTTGISNKEVTTSVYMKSGETVVIGGIYQQDKANQKAAVPWLASIPIVGLLFKKDFKRDNRTELLIFLTPKVLKEGATPVSG